MRIAKIVKTADFKLLALEVLNRDGKRAHTVLCDYDLINNRLRVFDSNDYTTHHFKGFAHCLSIILKSSDISTPFAGNMAGISVYQTLQGRTKDENGFFHISESAKVN